MGLVISSDRLAQMVGEGLENNPIMTAYEHSSQAVYSADVPSAVGASVQNAQDLGTYSYWRPDLSVASDFALTMEFAAPVLINFIGLVAHNLVGVTVLAEVSNDGGVTWIGVAESEVVDRSALGLYFPDQTVDRVRLLFGTDVGADISIGVVSVGQMLTVPTRIYQGYTPLLRSGVVSLQSNVTEGGNYVSTSVVRRGRSGSFDLRYLKPEFVRGAAFGALQRRFNDGLPFFWAWRPMKYDDLNYAWRAGPEMQPDNTGPADFMGVRARFRAYDDET